MPFALSDSELDAIMNARLVALRYRLKSMKKGRLSVESFGPSGWFTICGLRLGMYAFKMSPIS